MSMRNSPTARHAHACFHRVGFGVDCTRLGPYSAFVVTGGPFYGQAMANQRGWCGSYPVECSQESLLERTMAWCSLEAMQAQARTSSRQRWSGHYIQWVLKKKNL